MRTRNRTILLLVTLVFSLAVVSLPARAAVRYTPKQGDSFSYHEVIDLNQGTGAYEGYTEHSVYDGTERMNTIYGNGTVATHYSYTWSFTNSSGGHSSGGYAGNFTYSSTTFHYEIGTDNQTGYSNPYVWFYMDNTTQNSGSFYLLNTNMTVQNARATYNFPNTSRYVYAILATGSSSYQRNDVYGIYSAPFTWTNYFDPNTGYIIGYVYSEHDTGIWQGQSAGFTWTDTLYVTTTSYALAAAPAPPPNLTGLYIILGLVGLFILFFIVIAIVLIRRRPRLREHPSHQLPVGIPQYNQSNPPWNPQQQGSYPQQQGGVNLQPPQQPPVQQIVVKEIVKVKCRYCGALIDGTAAQCPFCGAPRT